MVYYLRPHSNSNRSSYRLSPESLSSSAPSMNMDSSKLSNSSEDDGMMHKLTPYLVIAIIVAAVTAIFVLQVLKPSESCATFLTKTENGKVVVCPLRVTAFSLASGALISLICYLVHSVQPSLLDL
jgi:hypothetical protein